MKLKEIEAIRAAHVSQVGRQSPEASAIAMLCDEVMRLRLALMDVRDPRPSQKWQTDKIDAVLST